MTTPHFDDQGRAHMVNVSNKPTTRRFATVSAIVEMNEIAAGEIRRGTARKGDVLAVARLAGINGSKWTPMLIPLCHSIPVESVEIDFQWIDDSMISTASRNLPPSRIGEFQGIHQLRVVAEVSTVAKTGIEMEAFTAVSVCCLTVIDMLKAVDRHIRVRNIQLETKSGGASGEFVRGSSDVASEGQDSV
ncbi:MAG: cyclic pyranopterin monophosphate synthase MoaC [Planctomycetota bacterium]